jgi:hypothetical protein
VDHRIGVSLPEIASGTESLLTLRWREVDSNFQYADTGESRHPLLWCPIALDELARARVLLGSYDLTREEIWVNLIQRDRPHALKVSGDG